MTKSNTAPHSSTLRVQSSKSPFSFEKMDSGNDGEAAFARYLDVQDDIIAWTKNHGIVIRYRKPDGALGSYHPDFYLARKNQSSKELIEVKDARFKADPTVKAKAEAAVAWCKRRGMIYRMCWARGRSQFDLE